MGGPTVTFQGVEGVVTDHDAEGRGIIHITGVVTDHDAVWCGVVWCTNSHTKGQFD